MVGNSERTAAMRASRTGCTFSMMEPVKARLGSGVGCVGAALEAADDYADEPGEIFAFLAEDFGGYGVALIGAAEDDFGEAGEVGGGAGVGVLDEEIRWRVVARS